MTPYKREQPSDTTLLKGDKELLILLHNSYHALVLLKKPVQNEDLFFTSWRHMNTNLIYFIYTHVHYTRTRKIQPRKWDRKSAQKRRLNVTIKRILATEKGTSTKIMEPCRKMFSTVCATKQNKWLPHPSVQLIL